MDFADLLASCEADFLRTVADRRHIRCSYLEQDDISPHRKMVVKTFMRQLEQPENIEQALMQLTAEQIDALRILVQGGRPDPNQVADLVPYGFFLMDGDRQPVFHEYLADMVEDWVIPPSVTPEQVDNRPSYYSYGAYVSMANALAMRRVRCLVDRRPGQRMLDCIRERLPIAGADFAWGYLYDFLVGIQLLVFEPETGLLTPTPLMDRSAFYTNLFRYVFSQENGERLALRLGAGAPQITVVQREQLVADGMDPTWLMSLDLIRPLETDGFVVTSLAQSFLSSKDRAVVVQESEDSVAYTLPGFRIMADPLVPTDRLDTLSGIAELERYDQVFQFTLSTCSLIQARRSGMTADDMITAVTSLAGSCPNDMKRMIIDTLDRYGEVRIFSGYPVIVGRDTMRTEQVIQQEDIAKHIRYRSHHALILESDQNPLDIKRMLVDAGLIPELDRNREFRPVHRQDLNIIAELMTKLKEYARKDGGETLDRVEDLLTRLGLSAPTVRPGPKAGAGFRKTIPLKVADSGTMALEDRMEILQFAMSRNYRLQVRYKQKGTEKMEQRVIRPRYLDGDFLVAYCENRDADRRFNLYRLEINGLIVEGQP